MGCLPNRANSKLCNLSNPSVRSAIVGPACYYLHNSRRARPYVTLHVCTIELRAITSQPTYEQSHPHVNFSANTTHSTNPAVRVYTDLWGQTDKFTYMHNPLHDGSRVPLIKCACMHPQCALKARLDSKSGETSTYTQHLSENLWTMASDHPLHSCVMFMQASVTPWWLQ